MSGETYRAVSRDVLLCPIRSIWGRHALLVQAAPGGTGGHTGADVPVTAAGPLAEQFTGKHPNTHVHEVLSQILTSRH